MTEDPPNSGRRIPVHYDLPPEVRGWEGLYVKYLLNQSVPASQYAWCDLQMLRGSQDDRETYTPDLVLTNPNPK